MIWTHMFTSYAPFFLAAHLYFIALLMRLRAAADK
jgi:hypothetical protein